MSGVQWPPLLVPCRPHDAVRRRPPPITAAPCRCLASGAPRPICCLSSAGHRCCPLPGLDAAGCGRGESGRNCTKLSRLLACDHALFLLVAAAVKPDFFQPARKPKAGQMAMRGGQEPGGGAMDIVRRSHMRSRPHRLASLQVGRSSVPVCGNTTQHPDDQVPPCWCCVLSEFKPFCFLVHSLTTEHALCQHGTQTVSRRDVRRHVAHSPICIDAQLAPSLAAQRGK